MQVTYIGLSEYFERCIPQAKREGYLFIISLIARYSDAQDLYEKLEKDWASLNDLTGDKILFVFSTPKVRKRASFFHMPGKEPYEGVMCPFVELLDGRNVEQIMAHLNIYMMAMIKLIGNKNIHRQLRTLL